MPELRRRRRGLGALSIVGAALLTACGTVPTSPSAGSGSSTPTGPSATAGSASPGAGAGGDGTCAYEESGEAARPVTLPPTTGVPTSGSVAYVLEMTGGDVTVTMDRTKAPCTVNSFVSLAEQGYFDKTSCHRLADSGIFILQCGDPTATGRGGPGYQFANETDGTESYTSGLVAMANAGPDTNGSQFFLIWDDSTQLDRAPNYTVFGRLDAGSRDVVASMAAEGQDGSGGDGTGKPNNPSEIVKVTLK